MEILTMLQGYGVINIAVVIAVIGVMTQLRKSFIDKLLENVKISQIKWVILTTITYVLSIGFSALGYINKFNLGDWIKISVYNWVFAWIFYDTIKNLFFKQE